MSSPIKRKGRPLLAAAAGVAFVSFAGCQLSDPKPVGNLRAPETPPPTAGADTGTVLVPSGGSTSAEPVTGGTPSSGGTATGGSAPEPPVGPPIMPVGNLRPPEDPAPQPEPPPPPPKPTAEPGGTKKPLKPLPVGNLRPPDTK